MPGPPEAATAPPTKMSCVAAASAAAVGVSTESAEPASSVARQSYGWSRNFTTTVLQVEVQGGDVLGMKSLRQHSSGSAAERTAHRPVVALNDSKKPTSPFKSSLRRLCTMTRAS